MTIISLDLFIIRYTNFDKDINVKRIYWSLLLEKTMKKQKDLKKEKIKKINVCSKGELTRLKKAYKSGKLKFNTKKIVDSLFTSLYKT